MNQNIGLGTRDLLQKHPRLAIGAVTVAIVCAAVFCVYAVTNPNTVGHKAWFTDDDGKTWFADDSSKLAPFDHDGKQAVLCVVYSCDGGKTKFVSYMMRVSPEGQQAIQDVMKKRAAGDKNAGLVSIPMQVKAPGDGEWVGEESPAGRVLITPHSPDGSLQDLQMIDPNG